MMDYKTISSMLESKDGLLIACDWMEENGMPNIANWIRARGWTARFWRERFALLRSIGSGYFDDFPNGAAAFREFNRYVSEQSQLRMAESIDELQPGMIASFPPGSKITSLKP